MSEAIKTVHDDEGNTFEVQEKCLTIKSKDAFAYPCLLISKRGRIVWATGPGDNSRTFTGILYYTPYDYDKSSFAVPDSGWCHEHFSLYKGDK